MRVAVIGAGVSGLSAAWALSKTHRVTLFEQDSRLGGHANTVTIDYDGRPIDVDTGFIVYNELNYPNFTKLLDHLDVETIASDMSFSVSDPDGFEWSSNGFSGLFAWKRNIASPQFFCMLHDIVRFSAAARADLGRGGAFDQSLEDYVSSLKLGRSFLRQYLLPMGAAIWSTPEHDMLRFPAAAFIRFFNNHRLLHLKRPKWRTIAGGSRRYVEAIKADLGDDVRLNAAVTAVERHARGVTLRTSDGERHEFDAVVLACHSDQALALLDAPSEEEQRLLSAVRYAPNRTYLHRDPALMPRRRAAWSSWNYLRSEGSEGRVCVSYWMNALQAIPEETPLFVTLNPAKPPAPDLTFGAFDYDHPQFDLAAIAAQRGIAQIQGRQNTYFAGAWLRYGFHEDGLASGLEAARALGARAPWDSAPGADFAIEAQAA